MKRLIFIPLLFLFFVSEAQFTKGGGGFLKTGSNTFITAPSEPPDPFETLMADGNTVVWFEDDVANITKDGSDLVSAWDDLSSNDDDLLQATETNQPTWTSSGVVFDGVDNFMKITSGWSSIDQPVLYYFVFQSVDAINGETILEGSGTNYCRFYFSSNTTGLRMYSGATGTEETDLAENTLGIVRVLFNTTASTIQANEATAHTGFNVGTNAFGTGFTLGANAAGSSAYSNIKVRALIIRKVVDDSEDQTLIYDYLATKYSL